MQQRREELFVHLVWSTWDRKPMIDNELRPWLWATIATIAREIGCPWVVVGGVEDHVHLLCALPATLAVAELANRVKGGSSRAANARNPESLRWQGGYAVFSVSPRDRDMLEAYVRNQELHHSGRLELAEWE